MPENISPKMLIEIWSDIVCPFCYIGKRRLENALELFSHQDRIEINWKSYQLSPDLKTNPEQSINQFLAEHKQIPVEEAEKMNDYVTEMASEVGLTYHFEKAVVANSFNAHRLIHLSKEIGKQHEAEELLFRSYFTDGKNIDDTQTLVQLGVELGLEAERVISVLNGTDFADEVRKDVYDAFQVGVKGVPFFVFDRKYGISGAQPASLFTQVLEKSFSEWNQNPLNQKTV
ncbi:MAG: DsbA family oxidoreductase [Bacteroidetes bacterium]|nr:DsbA family oxidoreductase [Bacteroidota bacterium]